MQLRKTMASTNVHFLCMDLPHSDDRFVMAFPAERTESFLGAYAALRRGNIAGSGEGL
jgi:hypothetical protein